MISTTPRHKEMTKFHIYIFRHGETYYNRSKRFTGWVNSRLTPRGKTQSNIIAEKLKEKKLQIGFKTSLLRSSDSLGIVLKHHPECQKIIIDDRIMERSYGDLERKFHKTVIRKYGIRQGDNYVISRWRAERTTFAPRELLTI